MVSGEKRNCEEENGLEKINTILLDIEGTTTSISFVKDKLFPYVKENLKAYVDSHWEDDEFKGDLKALKEQAKKDEEDKVDGFCPIEEGEKEKESLIKNVLWQMDLDRKTTALKQLQGHIWREGYENGKLRGHFFNEVAQSLKKWCEDGRKLYTYSSGSAEAQKLLFKNSEIGDLQNYLSGYFDTEVGPKTEASSYTNIVKSIGCESNQILFLTDVVKEAVAADKAGLQVMIVIREGNVPLTDDEKKAFTTITNFTEIGFESSHKKKKIEDENIGQDTAKAQNDEKTEEKMETENGETEKMEVTETTEETTENSKEDAKTEEIRENKTEEIETSKPEEPTEKPEPEGGDPDTVNVDVDDSNKENGSEEKVVSSSNDEKEEKKEEATTNGVVEKEDQKESSSKIEEESSTKVEKESKEEKVDSTNETPAPVSESGEQVEETTKEESEAVSTNEKEKEEEKSVNGHENGEVKPETETETETEVEVSKEVEAETNGQIEETENVPVKKVAPEEQADSTVEVVA